MPDIVEIGSRLMVSRELRYARGVVDDTCFTFAFTHTRSNDLQAVVSYVCRGSGRSAVT